VVSSSIRNLHFERKVNQQLEDKWTSSWSLRAEDEREYVTRLRNYRVYIGAKDGLRAFSFYAARRLSPQLLASPLPKSLQDEIDQMREAVRQMMLGNRMHCIRDPELFERLAGEDRQLTDIINQI
jgi:hypothetical protein